MKTIRIAIAGMAMIVAFSGYRAPVTAGLQVAGAEKTVYLCNGPYSKKYHYVSNCRGLSNCSTRIEATTLEEARKRGRTLCGYED